MTLVAGVDSSTQSCKAVIRDLATGAVVRSGRAPHPRTADSRQAYGGSDPAGGARYILTGIRGDVPSGFRRRRPALGTNCGCSAHYGRPTSPRMTRRRGGARLSPSATNTSALVDSSGSC